MATCANSGLPPIPAVCNSFDTCAKLLQEAPGAQPSQYGCTSWDACSWACTSQGCVKVGYDTAFKEPCCFGTAAEPLLQCDPTWCVGDPQGACTDLIMAACTGTSSCGRHKFLTPSQSLDTGDAPCNLWYLGVKDNAITGVCWGGASCSMDPLVAAENEIARFCSAEGVASGECSCYNAYQACTVDTEGQGGCLIAGATGERNVARRVDIYCNGGFSTTTEDGAWVTLSDTCNPNVGYGSPTINPGSSNPYEPAGGVNPFPAHCWLPACQMQSEDCMFKSLPDLRRACPPICMQFASGNNVVIDGTTTPTVQINVADINCGSWDGVGAQSFSPYLWPSSEMSIEMPVGYQASFSIPLTNTSLDSATNFNTMATDLFSTLEPIVTLPAGAGNPLSLPNGSTTDVWVTVDTGGLFEGQNYEGLVMAVDHSKANGPGTILFTLDVLGSAGRASVQVGSGATLYPPTTPATHSGPTALAPTPRTAESVAVPRGERGQPSLQRVKAGAQPSKRSGGNGWVAPTILTAVAAILLAALVCALVKRNFKS